MADATSEDTAKRINVVIASTGSFGTDSEYKISSSGKVLIPSDANYVSDPADVRTPNIVKTEKFLEGIYYDPQTHKPYKYDGTDTFRPTAELIEEVTGKLKANIEQRIHSMDLTTSGLATIAAKNALAPLINNRENTRKGNDAGIDGIIVGTNYFDLNQKDPRSSTVSGIASKVKNQLGITDSNVFTMDISSGCPGSMDALITAYAYILSGMAKRVLVIGAETLSPTIDPYDRNGAIFADGAGAIVVERKDSKDRFGVIAPAWNSHTSDEYLNVIKMDSQSYNNLHTLAGLVLHMNGKKVYEYVSGTVPKVAQQSLDAAGLTIADIDKIVFHQANERLLAVFLAKMLSKAFPNDYKGLTDPEKQEKAMATGLMPMNIKENGNSSVATWLVLLDEVLRGKIEGQELYYGNKILIGSVGAGMNIRTGIYEFPTREQYQYRGISKNMR